MEQDQYIEKLSKKDLMHMTFTELEDWLDYIICDKMNYHTFNPIQKDTFNHLLIYFRLNHFALQNIMAKAENNQYFIKAMMLLLKEKDPKMTDMILEMVENMNKEHNDELLKQESPEDQETIKRRVKETRKD